MFSLLSGLYQNLTAYPEHKILLLGLEDSGKTTLLNGIKKHQGLKYIDKERIRPTKGLNLAKFDYNKVNLTIWDLSGDFNYRSIWEDYYKDCDCL